MSCCGQKRAAAASNAIQGRRQATPIPAPTPAEVRKAAGDGLVRYLGAEPLSLRGPHSGRVYYFAEAGKTASVDEIDIDAMLRTRLFVREADA